MLSSCSSPCESVEGLSEEICISIEMTAGLVTALCWVLRSAAANSLDHPTLHQELLQLGTPKEHAGAMARVYREHSATLISLARQNSLRLSSLESVESKVILLCRDADTDKHVWEKRGQLRIKTKCNNTITNRFCPAVSLLTE